MTQRISSWTMTLFRWLMENKIADKFIQYTQYLADNKILIIVVNNHVISELKVFADG